MSSARKRVGRSFLMRVGVETMESDAPKLGFYAENRGGRVLNL